MIAETYTKGYKLSHAINQLLNRVFQYSNENPLECKCYKSIRTWRNTLQLSPNFLIPQEMGDDERTNFTILDCDELHLIHYVPVWDRI